MISWNNTRETTLKVSASGVHRRSLFHGRNLNRTHMQQVSLSTLVEEAISSYILRNPFTKTSFEIQQNIMVAGEYASMQSAMENLVENAMHGVAGTSNPSVIFGKIENEEVYYMMNSGSGTPGKPQFIEKPFDHMEETQYHGELAAARQVILTNGGLMWGVGREHIGTIIYFSFA